MNLFLDASAENDEFESTSGLRLANTTYSEHVWVCLLGALGPWCTERHVQGASLGGLGTGTIWGEQPLRSNACQVVAPSAGANAAEAAVRAGLSGAVFAYSA